MIDDESRAEVGFNPSLNERLEPSPFHGDAGKKGRRK